MREVAISGIKKLLAKRTLTTLTVRSKSSVIALGIRGVHTQPIHLALPALAREHKSPFRALSFSVAFRSETDTSY